MRTDTATITRLVDYRPSDHLVPTIALDIRLQPSATRIRSVMEVRPNPAGRPGAPLVLDGDELMFHGVELDGVALEPGSYAVTPAGFTLLAPPERPFSLAIDTEVNPTANTKLMGLYRSGGVYCTQCEADGFRRIAYALDRPDCLSVYTTRIEAEHEDAPILLGNGNLVEAGTIEGTDRHYVIWSDPFPKPAYLFAVVGGALAKIAKTFTTLSGRAVEIAIWVEPGKEARAGYALDALERSMRWDERVFGREYDLDVFNVVAVADFNMGAMENKGLNIFNDKYVLASPDVATDGDYAGIETVIAHEYFHNWTGNRITCRDWFQLCLKEGLTVFRDQEFSSDERSRPVQRIAEVRTLRARQFSEDAGPLAHPVRPSEYREINNFYTATVYEKGAEIVRMLKTLVGEDAFARGMARYFERCDGMAATVEDFISAFAATSGRDLAHFARWYAQAGTPTLLVETHHDPAAGTYRIDFAQATKPTPGQPDKEALIIPVRLGFLDASGREVTPAHERLGPEGLFVLDRAADHITFTDMPARPVPSVLRGFSAPVKLMLDLSDADLLTLLRHDSDAFNRWQSAQSVALRILVGASTTSDARSHDMDGFADALEMFLADRAEADPAFAALVLGLPGETEIGQEIGRDVDPDAVHRARRAMRARLGVRLGHRLLALRDRLDQDGPYSPEAAAAGARALRNAALDLVSAGDPAVGAALCGAQIESATNMTDRLAALSILSLVSGSAREDALAAFGTRYAGEPLVIDKWFAIQAAIPEFGTLERVRGLMNHPAFSFSNPNRVRSLVGVFAMGNPTQFHRPDGAGHALVAETVLALNASNPQIAARLLTAFGPWRNLEAGRRARAEESLRLIAAHPGLSPDVADIAARSLEQA